MASTTALTGLSRATAATPPLRQLWQVPTFLLGLLALAAVCLARPPWHGPRATCGVPAFAPLRELLKQPDFDRDRALVLGAEAVRDAGPTPRAAAEAHFLLGSVYAALAERAGAGPGGDPWREARTHLEQAKALGVPEDDRTRLDYRLGKAWAHTGEPPQKVIAALAPAAEEGPEDDLDAVRGYGLLAEAYLKLPRPDLEAALAATEKQIGRPITNDDLLAPARLRRGELLLSLGRPDEAAGALKNVGAKAPPAVAAQARRLRVRILEEQEQWAEAAAVWREVLDDAQAPPRDREVVLYHFGLCLRNGDRKDEALRAWEECLRRDPAGEEGPAAALGVAELRLREPQVEPALTAFERAVRDVKGPGDWHNALVTVERAREAFEAGCRAARSAGAFEASARLARLYERLAPPGRAQELLAEAADAWAGAAREKARRASGDEARKLYGEAEDLLRQAAAAYEQAADAQKDPAEQAERLWSAANRFLEGRDADRAAAAFERFLKVAQQPDLLAAERFNARLSEAWYKLALARRDAGSENAARAAFAQAAGRSKWSSRYVYRARYELAYSKRTYDSRTNSWAWTDDAENELEANLRLLREARDDRDDEAREKTLYALGDLYFERREQNGLISKAINTLEEALHDFPGNSGAVYARYQLAESYRLRADQRSRNFEDVGLGPLARLGNEQKVMEDREKAIATYQELSRGLEARTSRDESEERLLAYALEAAADLRFLAGGYAKAGEMYEAFAERYKGRPEEHATAVADVLRAYWHAAKYPAPGDDAAKVRLYGQKAQRALEEIRAALPKLEPKKRAEFERWLKSFEPPAAGGSHPS